MNKNKKLCINLYGGANIGKTTLAAELFVELKKHNLDVELVAEFAKDVILEGRPKALEHQWYVIANQIYKIWCAYQVMQVVLVDSPVLLGPIYDKDASPAVLALCLEHHHRYNNLNLVLGRNPEFEYSMAGRVHSLTESISVDNRIVRMLEEHDIPYLRYDEYGKTRIVDLIMRSIKE